MNPIASFQQADAYINSFINLERGQNPFTKRTYRLDRMEFLLDLFGRPERSFESLHIAGSKGKGSTAAMAASVLEAAGHTVGLFTSPHLLDIRERFCVNRRPIARALYFELLTGVKRVLDPIPADGFPGGIQPTFFEIMTLVGFLAFREKRCRYAVLEVGLGGRLDATNVVTPLASLLTFMELEHEDVLGDTIEKIVREKCGIIKPGVPVFASGQSAAARKVIEATAAEQRASVTFVSDAVTIEVERTTLEKTDVRLKLAEGNPDRFSLSLIGAAQAENAALVYLTLSRLFPDLDRQALKIGLERAVLPGRMEVVRRRPLVVLDGAHTPGSAARLAALVRDLIPAPRLLLFAAVTGKKHREMAALLAPLFDRIVVSTPGTFKKSTPHDVYSAFRELHADVVYLKSPEEAFREAWAHATGNRSIVVTGSFYFIAEIKKLLKRKRR